MVRRVRVVSHYRFRDIEITESERIMDGEAGWWYVVASPRGFTYTRALEEAIEAFRRKIEPIDRLTAPS